MGQLHLLDDGPEDASVERDVRRLNLGGLDHRYSVPSCVSTSASSTCCRSAGSGAVNSIGRSSVGCVNTSLAACRNGRSSRSTGRRSAATCRRTPPYVVSPTIG